MQLLNLVAGGRIVWDLPHGGEAVTGAPIAHTARPPAKAIHAVAIEPASRLYTGDGEGVQYVAVRSAHHQAIERLGPGLQVTGRSDDGVVELIEAADPSRWVVGVQWHPEKQLPRVGPDAGFAHEIFTRFVHAAAIERGSAREPLAA